MLYCIFSLTKIIVTELLFLIVKIIALWFLIGLIFALLIKFCLFIKKFTFQIYKNITQK